MDLLKISELQGLLHVDKERLMNYLKENSVEVSDAEMVTNNDMLDWILACLLNARFEEIFSDDRIRALLAGASGDKHWHVSVMENLRCFINETSYIQDVELRQVIVLFMGVAALQMFVQANWIGPFRDRSEEMWKLVASELDRNELLEKLCFCNLPVYPLIRSPEFLLLAKLILYDLDFNTFTKAWWKLRYLSVHQEVLEDKNSAIYLKIQDAVNEALTIPVCKNKDIGIQLRIETVLICLRFHDITKAKEYLKAVQQTCGLGVKLSGALGTKTKFQTIPYSQLFLQTEMEESPNSSLYCDSVDIPVDVKLQDETLLNNINFIGSEESESSENLLVTRAEDQSLILALSVLHQKQTAHDELLEDELNAYTDYILSHPSNFCIKFCALLLRCKLEKKRSKKVERAMTQLQTLLDHTKKQTENSCNRFQLFYSTPMPPTWIVEKELANVLLSLGSVKSALDIFLRLEMWEECIFCYKSLERNDKALQIVETQLQVGKTPILLCLKGDLTNDPSWYEEAWELSDQHSARAKRSLGYYYFQRKEYDTCIPHLLASVEIDSLEQKAWFYLGHAATQIENYELAAKCYRHLVNLDQDSFEAWNNLSNAYIRLNDKIRAWRTLQEAIKCNFEEWKVWENYLLVSVDVGAFEEAINAWHRLIDIKGKHVDEEVLSILVKAIIQNVKDINDQPASSLLEKTLKLMGHITSADTTSFKTWASYATLLEHKATKTEDNELLDRVIQYYQKSWNIIRNEIQKNLYLNLITHYRALLDCSCTITDIYLRKFSCNSQLSLHSVKLLIRNTITQTQQASDRFSDSERTEVINPLLQELEKKLETVTSLIN